MQKLTAIDANPLGTKNIVLIEVLDRVSNLCPTK